MVEKPWFRDFMKDVEPRFKNTSRRSVDTKVSALATQRRSHLLKKLAAIAKHGLQPSFTLDFWMGRDSRSFMGCTIHYVCDKQLKHTILCFKEVPPTHTSDSITLHFEGLHDCYEIRCFQIITDNAANMKCVFLIPHEIATQEIDDDDDDDDDDDIEIDNEDLEEWNLMN
uniref:Uncharacterized protein n=1 Tax=Amphimedon queenslandica TaxID=400682 RepID=A0A1X7SKX7_AMPQE